MNKGITISGNAIMDSIYRIENYPEEGELTKINGAVVKRLGGALCNVIIDLAKIDGDLPLEAVGLVGEDENGALLLNEFVKYPSINCAKISKQGTTGYTHVYNNVKKNERTFFHDEGCNRELNSEHFDVEHMTTELFHIGYISLLPKLDAPDSKYGTKLAKLLARIQTKGIKTSIDLVSNSDKDYADMVIPTLRYTNYCVINELEAEAITGIPLRDQTGKLIEENFEPALIKIADYGVKDWVVIHCPEVVYGLASGEELVKEACFQLPPTFIKGNVGAGDAFCSGVLYGAYKEVDLQEAMKLGIITATCSLSSEGSTDGVTSLANMKERVGNLVQ